MPPTIDPAVDAYIAEAPEFARPILERLRADFHHCCPEVRECLKWSQPFFEASGPLGGMSAFKAHVTLSFWRGADLEDPEGLLEGVGRTAMRTVKFTSLGDVPAKRILRDYIKRAVAHDARLQAAPKKKATSKKKSTKRRPPPVAPSVLVQAFKKAPAAKKTFEGMSPTHQREYVEWIEEAKRESTRDKRVATAIEWLQEGKSRNWKYTK